MSHAPAEMARLLHTYSDDMIDMAAIDAEPDLELLSRVVAATGLVTLIAMMEREAT